MYEKFRKRLGFVLIAPAMICIVSVLLYPLLYSAYLSLFSTFVGPGRLVLSFVGLRNYLEVLSSPDWWLAFGRTSYFVLYDIVVGMSMGLGIALLFSKQFRLRGVARALILFPYVLPSIVRALMWKWIYNSNYGFLDGILYQLGIIKSYIAWLSDPRLAIHMLIVANIWEGTPFAVIMYLAALQTIPLELYEASKVDGASAWQMFGKVTFPLLRPMTFTLIVMKIVATFKIFDLIYALTGGGPGSSTQVVGYLMYNTVFRSLQFGKGAAMSYLTLLIILGLVLFFSRVFRTDTG